MSTLTPIEAPAERRAASAATPIETTLTHRANARRNAIGSGWTRRRRWRPARDALWAVLSEHVAPDARVAVVGAGNGDDLPLRRLARRASSLDLIDLDDSALRRAERRTQLAGGHVTAIIEDVTMGAADAIVRRAQGEQVPVAQPAPAPVGRGRYDVVVADLMLTQLLFPALVDSGLPGSDVDDVLLAEGQPLTNRVIARLHAAAPGGAVVLVHDLLGWWDGHPQPLPLDAVLALAATDPTAALTVAAQGDAPYGCDPVAATRAVGARIVQTALWRWPFASGIDYLVCATVARTAESQAGR